MRNFFKKFITSNVFVLGLTLAVVLPVAASNFMPIGGNPTPNFSVENFDYINTWRLPMDRAIQEWNGTPTRVRISKSDRSNNTINAQQYSFEWYGLYTHFSYFTDSFKIELNSRTISRDSTNFENFIQGH